MMDPFPVPPCVRSGWATVQLSGPVLGRVAALAKHFIEVTKLWEARGLVRGHAPSEGASKGDAQISPR